MGLGQASGRVDVPDGAKIEAAAAFAGTFRSRPGKLDALRSVRSTEGKVQFFLKEYDGHTRVIRCHDYHSIHDAVGYDGWDIMLQCMVTFLTSLILFRVWVYLTMAQIMCMADSVEGRITRTFLVSGSVEIVLRRGVGQCGEIATGVECLVRTILQLLLLGMLEKVKGGTKALQGETLCLGRTMCRSGGASPRTACCRGLPDGLLDAYIARMPKTDDDATGQLEDWFQSSVLESVFSDGGGRGSVEAWYASSLDIEEVLTGAADYDVHLFVAGVVNPFDTVDREILDRVLSSLGLPAWFRNAHFEYASPVQHFEAAILDAWRNKVSADLCCRKGFRGGPLFDVHGSLQLLNSSHVRERDEALLRTILVGGVWNGFLLGRVRDQPVPCRFCGAPDGDGYLFWECTS